MAAPPGMNPWTSCHLLHEPDGLLHLPTRETAVAYHRCVFMSWPRMETHGDPDGWSARQMTDLCFSQWEEDVGSAQCSTTLNQHVLFTQTNLLCQGRPGSTCYFRMMIHIYIYITVYINSIDLTCDVPDNRTVSRSLPSRGVELNGEESFTETSNHCGFHIGLNEEQTPYFNKNHQKICPQRLGPWSCEIWSFVSAGSTQQGPPQADTADCEQGLWSKVNHELLNDRT